ncbi:MAG: oxidoreductase, partial [Aeromicrobium sp.]|nr:oxidoreductase [Aeromicrobium sp.]
MDPSARTAVVTGASSGIGAATARALAGAGYHVICAARRVDRLEELAAEIGGHAIACDVTDVDQVGALAAAVGGTLDVLVNNAGGAFGVGPVIDSDPDQWRQMYEINVIGTLNVTKALAPALIASGAGTIINTGSIAGHLA